ncbi:unnamed protein product [Nippostrongylus brasiliensis]|uniref:guanylate cyclase n=1 Tax=Nippostrongylus brasiliensis TaxID=27835 RepID=A0A0N4XVC2_NIPBR|nr:unnamed protein product [Nippostrongylus brasiliensis]
MPSKMSVSCHFTGKYANLPDARSMEDQARLGDEIKRIVGWREVAGGVGVAWDKIISDRILPEYDVLNLTWVMGECVESVDAGAVIDWVQSGADVVIGPACSASAIISGTIGKYFNFPLVIWAPTFSSALLNEFEYPTITATTFCSINQAQAIVKLLQKYQWTDVAVIDYVSRGSLIPRCSYVFSDLEGSQDLCYSGAHSRYEYDAFFIIYGYPILNCLHFEDILNANINMNIAYRRQLTAINNATFKTILSAIKDVSRVTVSCFESDLARRNFMVAIAELGMDTDEYVWIMVESRKLGFAQLHTVLHYFQATSQVGEVADALLLFAIAMNRSLSSGVKAPKGIDLAKSSVGVFEGFTGTVIINKNGSRDPIFYLWGLNSSDQQIVMMKITGTVDLDSVKSSFNVAKQSRFLTCCRILLYGEVTADRLHRIGLHAASMVVTIDGFILSNNTLHSTRARRREEERLNQLWQISYSSLQKASSNSGATSSRSLQSTMSTSTKLTIDSKKDTKNHSFFMYGNDSVAARKHKVKVLMKKSDCAALRKMQSNYHDNLCRFMGMCLDAAELMSLWRYCARGSLKDVIEKGSLQIDWFFKFSLIRDVIEGLHYVHQSFGPHGWLSSCTCLVDERWQVKITFYGMDSIKACEVKQPKQLLWTAPEHLRDPMMPPTTQGDIYRSAHKLIFKIKRGGRSPIRPSLDTDDEHNASLTLLVRDCWCEEGDQRPPSHQVRSLVKSLNNNKSSNLMDHVFNVLEQYASNLEEEVQARMKELTEEKKKSDILLYRMLPKEVAEKLKLGQSVEPETFDCVTLFFSDVVSFTTLASRCTPLQVVNLLNDLYTLFDAIIDEHDVYKVETIGDGYLCVSGLPKRNGNEHAKEIAEMSFELVRAIRGFRVPHLPNEKINIRVGLHTGALPFQE